MISRIKKRLRVLFVSVLVITSTGVQAQSQPVSATAETMTTDSRISAALKQMSAERIRANIEKLVSFGTRSTISAQDSAAIAAGDGAGAARARIKSGVERYLKACRARFEVKMYSVSQPPAQRI